MPRMSLCGPHVAIARIEGGRDARVPQAVGTRPDACQITTVLMCMTARWRFVNPAIRVKISP